MSQAPAELPAFGTPGRCLKCGRPIDLQETMCDVCNRAGMTAPAATQMHGTVAAAIVGSVVAMGVVASILVGGVGPFTSDVLAVGPVAEASVVVRLQVNNQGSRAGRARCELTAVNGSGSPVARTVVLSPEIPPGESVPFDAQIPGLTTDPSRVMVRCQ
ncbi:MAG TPA: hypothetical protein VGA91_07520 [Candidatus Limnocylindria bacterium]